jgi:hypothetical protein
MSVSYGSWLGAAIDDSFWAPHDLLTEIQDFVVEIDELRSADSANDTLVLCSVVGWREGAESDLHPLLGNRQTFVGAGAVQRQAATQRR